MVEDAACIIRKLAQCTNELQNEICIMRIINVILTQSMFRIFRIFLLRQVVYIFFSTFYILFCVTASRCTFWKMETRVKYFLLSCTFSTWSLPSQFPPSTAAVISSCFLAQKYLLSSRQSLFYKRNICSAPPRARSTKGLSAHSPPSLPGI